MNNRFFLHLCYVTICFVTFAISQDECQNALTNTKPFLLREVGGEQLSIDIPCLSEVSDNIKCKFESFPNIISNGKRVGEQQVSCVTPAFINLGMQNVFVSVDNGESFPYVGRFFVESEETLMPLITIQDFMCGDLFDFTSDKVVTLFWDRNLIPYDVITLKLIILENPILERIKYIESTALIENVENTGKLSFTLSNVISSETLAKFESIPITIGNFILTHHSTDLYLGGPNSIVSFKNIPFAACKLFDPLLKQTPKGTLPCPCNTTQASRDKNYNEEPDSPAQQFFHPGVATCYRSVPSEYGSSEQCCYNTDGNINIGTRGSGTADTYSPEVSTIKHILYDVLPWFACCKVAGQCDYYAKYRPSNDCANYIPPQGQH